MNQGHIYHSCQEEIPEDMPEPCGKPVMTTTFVDANLLHDVITGRSCTGIIHLLNKTPVGWFYKRQNTVDTVTYGSEVREAQAAGFINLCILMESTVLLMSVPSILCLVSGMD
eukprot:13165345-Ditylum_brightwellii.AAC.1